MIQDERAEIDAGMVEVDHWQGQVALSGFMKNC